MRRRQICKKDLVSDSNDNEKFIIAVLKAVLISLSVSLLGVLLFAFILKVFTISDNAIKPINQVIKACSIFVGVFIGFKKQKTMGLLKGMIVGLIYVVIAFFVFSALNGKFGMNLTLLNDCIFGGIMGAVCGVVAVNFLKKPA